MNNKKTITPSYLAIENIKKKPARTVTLIMIVAIFAFTLSSSSFLIRSLYKGLDNARDKMGADITVVPEGFDGKISGALLTGEPSSVYFSGDYIDKIKQVAGIDKMTPQLYIATLNNGCCSFPVQLIGIESKSDFLVKPWLKNSTDNQMREDEILVGKNIMGQVGGTLTFFDQELKIKERLNKTGFGFDNTVFMNIDKARELARSITLKSGAHPATKDENLISTVMVKVKKDAKPAKVSKQINQAAEGIYALRTENLGYEISKTMSTVSFYLYLAIGLFWLISFLVLHLVFSVIFQERKKEFAIYRMLGSTRKHLFRLMLRESIYIGGAGSLLGLLIGILLTIFFGNALSLVFQLPFLKPGFFETLIMSVMALVISAITGPIAALSSAKKCSKGDVIESLRD